MSFPLSITIELKRQVQEKFGVRLHFHDVCGSGTYFSLDEPNPQITAYIQKYFAALNAEVAVSPDGKNFSLD
ncbi:MAG: hypothetical protein IJ184_00930 [Alphaproteobacteria bacterium]|nr:hypothetical protein [Alphaproteobacteria bacterium]